MTPCLIGFGDIHIRKDKWYVQGFEEFINYIEKTLPDDRRDYTEICLPGDIVEGIALLPSTSAMVTNFFSVLFRKAKTVYVVLGNHDFGLVYYKIKSLRPFLESLGVVVIKDICDYTTNLGFRLLCIPHIPSQSMGEANEEVKKFEGIEFDCVVSHRELHPMIGSTEFLDLSKINSHCYFCGHIHKHNNDPKYLGSILPNKSDEVKSNDPSVMRIYIKDSKTYKDFDLPVFIDIQNVKVSSVTELQSFKVAPKTFYNFFISGNALTVKDVKAYCELYSIPLYDCDYEETNDTGIIIKENGEADLEKLPDLKELLDMYKSELIEEGFTEERLQKAYNLILAI